VIELIDVAFLTLSGDFYLLRFVLSIVSVLCM
jgi:hypothetical protein